MVKRLRNMVWKMNPTIITWLMRFFWKERFAVPTRISRDGQLIRITQIESNQTTEIFVSQPLRVSRYFIGIVERLERILLEYCVNDIQITGGSIVIDVGSNVGEFVMALERRYPKRFRYIRFEPAEEESVASQKNLQGINQVLIRKPLWFETTTLDFFELNESGDSSLIQPSLDARPVKMLTTTLDESLKHLLGERIELLKLEAEGAEPEVLMGATQLLPFISWIAADLGPERGLDKKETFEACDKILMDAGFKLWATNSSGRKSYLYRNVNVHAVLA